MPKDENAELADLHALFGHSTDVPRGMLLKYQVSKANREKADREREDKEARQKKKDEVAREQKERIMALRAKRGELDREAVAKLHAENRRNAIEIKAQEQAWEEERRQKQQLLHQKVRNAGSADFHTAGRAAGPPRPGPPRP